VLREAGTSVDDTNFRYVLLVGVEASRQACGLPPRKVEGPPRHAVARWFRSARGVPTARRMRGDYV
jgi:hypothetical protein